MSNGKVLMKKYSVTVLLFAGVVAGVGAVFGVATIRMYIERKQYNPGWIIGGIAGLAVGLVYARLALDKLSAEGIEYSQYKSYCIWRGVLAGLLCSYIVHGAGLFLSNEVSGDEISILLFAGTIFGAITGRALGGRAAELFAIRINACNEKSEFCWSAMVLVGRGLILVFMLVFMRGSLNMIESSGELAKRAVCSANLKGVGSGIASYSDKHGGEFPLDVKAMIEKVDMVMKCFNCPSDPEHNEDKRVSYVYRGVDLNNSVPGDMIVMYDKRGNHWGEVRNVLYVDGHVKKHREEDMSGLIERDNEFRRELGLMQKDLEQ